MHQSICILGRQPALSLAELESTYGSSKLLSITNVSAVLDVEPAEVKFEHLGGTIKLGQLLHTFDHTDWAKIEDYLKDIVPEHLQYLTGKKLTLGLSVYGLPIKPKQLLATGLEIKKVVREAGFSMRLVPNQEPALSSAQVLHNKLFTSDNWELVFTRDGNKVHLALTKYVQDIDAYAARDQKRPKRDARVGMLPPKLAQIIVNLVGQPALSRPKLLDPFCGTGVILQEALLMGYDAYGTDLEERMVDYSRDNLEWLAKKHDLGGQTYLLEVGDATAHEWQAFDAVATETYLGRPFSHEPKPDLLKQVMSDVNTIHKKFLKNLARQTEPGFRMCLAVPAWKIGREFKRLPTLDHLEELGYTRVSFAHARDKDLIYHREGQIVGRELVTLVRK